MAALRRSWQRAWRGMSTTGDGAATFDALIAAYGEPQRSHHTLQHLGECLESFLDRERIYNTAQFHGLLEERARKNLRAAVGQGAG